MLRQKLEHLPILGSEDDRKELLRQALKYSLNTTSTKKLNDISRKTGVFHEMKRLKPQFLKGSTYMLSNYWKAVLETTRPKCANCVNHKTCSQFALTNPSKCVEYTVDYEAIAKTHKVEREDLVFAEENLNESDIERIKKKYESRNLEQKSFSVEEIFKELYPWAEKLVQKKFHFILKNYWDIELMDLVHDLLLEGYLRALECDTMENRLYFINTIKRRVLQRAMNLIKFHTAGPRNRLELNVEEMNRQVKHLAKFYKKDHLPFEKQKELFKKTVDNQFTLKHLSVDFKMAEEDDEVGTSLSQYLVLGEPNQEEQLSEKQLLSKIIKDLPNDTYRRIVKILMGHYDSEFSHFLETHGDSEQVLKKVLEFFSVSKEEFYANLKTVLVKNHVVDMKKFEKLVANL